MQDNAVRWMTANGFAVMTLNSLQERRPGQMQRYGGKCKFRGRAERYGMRGQVRGVR